MTIRQEVMEHLVAFMRTAEDEGRDAMKAAEAAFPGTPEMVLILAAAELDHRRTEAWWKQVETTIDGAIIERALAAPGRRA